MPTGMSQSQSLTPVDGQWDTWQRGWRRSAGPVHIIIITFFPISIVLQKSSAEAQEGHSLVLDEIMAHGTIRVWRGSGIAVLQNDCKAYI